MENQYFSIPLKIEMKDRMYNLYFALRKEGKIKSFNDLMVLLLNKFEQEVKNE